MLYALLTLYRTSVFVALVCHCRSHIPQKLITSRQSPRERVPVNLVKILQPFFKIICKHAHRDRTYYRTLLHMLNCVQVMIYGYRNLPLVGGRSLILWLPRYFVMCLSPHSLAQASYSSLTRYVSVHTCIGVMFTRRWEDSAMTDKYPSS